MEQTIFEKNGIRYEQRGDFLYPVLGACDDATITGLGKYGTIWMSLLFEIDRKLHHQYLLEGILVEKAQEFQEYAIELEAEIVNNGSVPAGDGYLMALSAMAHRWQISQEVVIHDARMAITKNKELREEAAKKRLEELKYERTED